MPDLALCVNKTCPVKDECYRFTAPPSGKHQVYAEFIYYELAVGGAGGCEGFIPNNDPEAA